MTDLSAIQILHTTTSHPHALSLSALQRTELLLSVPTLPPFTDVIPHFLVLVLDNAAIACGGIKPLPDGSGNGGGGSVAEMKRVFVQPAYRGKTHGVADFLVRRLEALAVEQGYRVLRLQTGTVMEAANRFYQRHGYRRCENYGDYVGSETTLSFEKELC